MFTLQIPRCPGAGVGPPPGEPPSEADPPEDPPEDEVGVVSPPPHRIDTSAHNKDTTAIAFRKWYPPEERIDSPQAQTGISGSVFSSSSSSGLSSSVLKRSVAAFGLRRREFGLK